ncbi:IclR family transcriptional regulator [Niallia oryzisoli]|uniref:IclR family transcriptional regulator n=1 Tax=Niallia oryzisoli TaxID=1737571 RepID=A0ABZ2C8E9_9BACI
MVKEETKSQGIQSIEVGITILKKIAEARKPVSISEIAILCETSKSKLHRYLTSFVRTGMLKKDQNAKYMLGTEILRLGLQASQMLNIKDIAAPHLLDIKESLNETTALSIWGETGPFFVSWEESNRAANIGIKAGSQVSLTKSATGRVFAAFLPAEMTTPKISEELAISSIDEQQFHEITELIKKNGYAYVNSSLIPGINAIASPIFDQSSKLAAVLSVVGIESTLDTSEHSQAVQLIKVKASIVSKMLGFSM